MNTQRAGFPEFLYHATLRSNLDSILEAGLMRSKYGEIHERMEYHPPEDAVYLSTSEVSGNLHGSLFDKDQEVVVLRIRANHLDLDKLYPDDAFFYMLDEHFCEEAEDYVDDPEALDEFIESAAPKFCEMFGLRAEEGKKYLADFCRSDGSHEVYSRIARQMGGVGYLMRQGEAAYLADVPPTAIMDWSVHPNSRRIGRSHRSKIGPH